MDKIVLFVVLTILSFTFTNCSKEEEEDRIDNCITTVAATENALENYNTNNTTEFCNAYKDALTQQIVSCGDETGMLQTAIDDLENCIITPAEGSIKVNIGGVARNFNDNLQIEITGTTLEIRLEDDSAGGWVEFDIEQDKTGTDIISNFTIRILSFEYSPTLNETYPFISTISINNGEKIEGTFGGPVRGTNGADVDLTSGIINISL